MYGEINISKSYGISDETSWWSKNYWGTRVSEEQGREGDIEECRNVYIEE